MVRRAKGKNSGEVNEIKCKWVGGQVSCRTRLYVRDDLDDYLMKGWFREKEAVDFGASQSRYLASASSFRVWRLSCKGLPDWECS
jgi:hypothetical protein